MRRLINSPGNAAGSFTLFVLERIAACDRQWVRAGDPYARESAQSVPSSGVTFSIGIYPFLF